jgi:hypothetical protein
MRGWVMAVVSRSHLASRVGVGGNSIRWFGMPGQDTTANDPENVHEHGATPEIAPRLADDGTIVLERTD